MTDLQYGFGPHLMLDLYGCPKEKLSDLNFVLDILDNLPDKIGMTKISPPHVFQYNGKGKKNWGVSGVVLISESHISIHTFPENNHAFIDIFSCKEFDTNFARDELVSLFQAGRHQEMVKNRGAEFPQNVREVTDIVHQERLEHVRV